jgi:hypothetical protein
MQVMVDGRELALSNHAVTKAPLHNRPKMRELKRILARSHLYDETSEHAFA